MEPDSGSYGGGARTGGAHRIQAHRRDGPGLLSRLPGMAYQCRNDPDWTMDFVSDGCRALTGVPAEELVGADGVSYGDLVHPADREGVWDRVQRAVTDGEADFELQYRIVTAGGLVRDVWERGHAVRSQGGELLGLEGFITDITELEHTRRRLSDSEQMVGSLLEQALVGVYVIQDGRFRYVNPALAEVFGYTVDEIEGRLGPSDLTVERDRPRVREAIRRRLEDGEPSIQYEFSGLRKDGDTLRLEVHGSVVELSGKKAIAGVLIDVTQSRALEEQLHHAQRVEGLGELTGAIAHDFNNYLTAIIAPIELVLQDLPDDDPARAELLQARETAKRAATLTGQLLSFGRKRVSNPRPFDMNELLGTLRYMLDRVTGERVELDYRLTSDLPAVLADPSQFQQVVVNLVINARDAMPDGGRIVVETMDAAGVARGQDLDPGSYVALSVADSGHGIDDDTRRQMFDPYFTTKKTGTGLGLSTVFGIVRQHGGEIRVESTPGEGATFTILLPTTAERPDVVEADAEPSSSRTGGTATILVVEDEETVRRVVVATLRRFGYTVLEAEDGTGALEAEGTWDEGIDLLLTDLVLPDTTGPDLVSAIRDRRPALPVLLMSGYAPEDLLRNVRRGPTFEFLEKPFMIDELLGAVHRTLAGQGLGVEPGRDRAG